MRISECDLAGEKFDPQTRTFEILVASPNGFFVRTPENQKYGPFTKDLLDECYREGRLSSRCLIGHGHPLVWTLASSFYPDLDNLDNIKKKPPAPMVHQDDLWPIRLMMNSTTCSTTDARALIGMRAIPSPGNTTIINNYAGRDVNFSNGGVTE